MKSTFYQPPRIKVVAFDVEEGFQASQISTMVGLGRQSYRQQYCADCPGDGDFWNAGSTNSDIDVTGYGLENWSWQ